MTTNVGSWYYRGMATVRIEPEDAAAGNAISLVVDRVNALIDRTDELQRRLSELARKVDDLQRDTRDLTDRFEEHWYGDDPDV